MAWNNWYARMNIFTAKLVYTNNAANDAVCICNQICFILTTLTETQMPNYDITVYIEKN